MIYINIVIELLKHLNYILVKVVSERQILGGGELVGFFNKKQY